MDFPGNNLRPVHDDNIRALRMLFARDHIQQIRDSHGQPGFFQAFSLGCPGWIFPGVDKPGRKGPFPALWLIVAPHQQDLAVPFNQSGRGNFGVRKINPPAPRADRARAAKTFFQLNF
jgi:hypothetical protein